jgi:hypothetical protein
MLSCMKMRTVTVCFTFSVGVDMSDEELVRQVHHEVKRVYYSAFRHGFLSCLVGVLLFYTFF